MKWTVRAALCSAAALILCTSSAAFAQLVLPGAQPTAPGQDTGVMVPPPPRAPAAKIASESAVTGKTLYFNGAQGKLLVDRQGAGLQASLVAPGHKISSPVDSCGLDLGGGKPLEMVSVPRPTGTPRYEIRLPACVITLDILEGAALVDHPEKGCAFQASDCTIEARGLWGPTPGALDGLAGTIEKDRGRADRVVIESYKALYARARDKAETKSIAVEQANFSSARETICRNYAREAVHGFCATRFTELRATELVERISKIDGRTFVPESNRPKLRPADELPPPPPPPMAAAPPPAPRQQAPSFWPFNLFR